MSTFASLKKSFYIRSILIRNRRETLGCIIFSWLWIKTTECLCNKFVNDKDFLEYNWSDITKDSQAWNSYVDVLKSSPNLMTTYGLSGTVPFAEVGLFHSDMTQIYHALFNYLCKLYSAPTYEDKTDKMWQLYDKLFSEQKKYPNAYPVAIWVTKRANIILLMLDEATDYPGYMVYAEPNRQ